MTVRANASENPKTKLSDDEMIAQMSSLTFAGHDTTASTMSWMLWELAKRPELQNKLRQEIIDQRAEVIARGDQDFSIDDLESMKLLQASLMVWIS